MKPELRIVAAVLLIPVRGIVHPRHEQMEGPAVVPVADQVTLFDLLRRPVTDRHDPSLTEARCVPHLRSDGPDPPALQVPMPIGVHPSPAERFRRALCKEPAPCSGPTRYATIGR